MARYLAVVAIGLVLATLAVGAIGSDADATQEGRLKEALRADWPRLSEAELTALAGMYMKHQDLGKQAGGGATGVQAMLEGGITPPMVAATVSAVILTLIAVKILGGGGGGGGGSGGAASVPTSTTPFEPLPMVEEGAQSISTSLTPLGGGDTEEIIREQLSRNTLFFGEAGVAATRRSFVVVVGLGGVGSHAAHMLLRSGVERLRIIDFDQVTLSSLNRHAVAQLQDVGVSKGAAMAAHFRRIAPHAEVEVRNEMFTAEAAEELLSGNPDWVLDCIDNFETKIDLLRYCAENDLRVIASMGAGARADPTKVEITDVYDTYRDPLAARVRGALRKAGVGPNIIPAVFSSEMPRVTLSDLPASAVEADANVSEFAPFDNFRVRVLPVLGPLPAIFGNIMATFVLSDLAGQPMDVSCPSGQGKTYAKILSKLRESERRIGQDRCLVDEEDVVALVERVWKRTSPINGVKGTKMQLRRWDQDQPASLTNAVLVTQAMVDDDDAEWTRAAVMAADPDRAARIDARLEEYAAWENAWI